MLGAASFVVLIADVAFFIALAACIIFSSIFGHYWIRFGENRIAAFISLFVFIIGCIFILLFALSTTNIGV